MRPPGPFVAATLAAFAVSLAAPYLPDAPFAAYFGRLAPPVAILLAGALGIAALARLQGQGWIPPGWPAGRPLALSFALGAACALPTIGLDLALPFPRNINAPLPAALAFCPAIGLVAETAFHLLPFAALSLVFPARPGLAVLAVALVEPAFQVWAGGGLDIRAALMAAILFGFGLAQMAALRRHGFAAAFAMRLGYYLVWHILWGAARTGLLFLA